jgi:cobalt/nickel transport protein
VKLRKTIVVLAILILLTPLGLLAPGEAWGEWGIEDWNVSESWKSVAERMANIWSAPLPDYNLPGWEEGALPYLGYIISAIIGVVLIVLITIAIGRILARK